MFESTQKMLNQFLPGEVPSLPVMILRGLDIQNQALQASASESNQQLANLLEDDISLYTKVLGAYHSQTLDSPHKPLRLLDSVGSDRVQALISQAALQSSFIKINPGRLKFFKLHWRQSSLSAIFAKELASQLQLSNIDEMSFSARFLNVGELVLENLDPSGYQRMHENANSESELVTAEIARFSYSHAELGSDLLEYWGITNGVCDALRYHHEKLGAILDASMLVKVCWLANLMANEGLTDSKVFAAGHRLFDLSKEVLIQIYTNGREQMQQKMDLLGMKFSSALRLPLTFSAEQEAELIAGDEAALLEISTQVEGLSLFNSLPVKLSDNSDRKVGEEGRGKALGESLSLLFGLQAGIVFCPDESGEYLTAWIGSGKAQIELAELQIKCEQNRSIVSESFVTGIETQGLRNDANRAVVDRQILSLLGSQAMVCDPVITGGKVVAVLVVGVQQGQAPNYLEKVGVRRNLKADIAECIFQPMEEVLSQNLSVSYDQRIREAIHEANNPLSIIKNYLQLLSIKQGEDSPILEEISVIKSEIDRVGGILTKLKNNAEFDDVTALVDANKIIRDLNKVFSASIFPAKEIQVTLKLDPELLPIYSKENALKQILTNILKNAAEALSTEGRITIKTSSNVYMENKHYIQITIIDNGPGIPVEAMDTLFLLGNSTKGEGHSGSGLAIVKNLVGDLGGHVSCQSDNAGTVFSFLLPRIVSPEERGSDND